MGFASLRNDYDLLEAQRRFQTQSCKSAESLAPASTTCWHLMKQQHPRGLILRQHPSPISISSQAG